MPGHQAVAFFLSHPCKHTCKCSLVCPLRPHPGDSPRVTPGPSPNPCADPKADSWDVRLCSYPLATCLGGLPLVVGNEFPQASSCDMMDCPPSPGCPATLSSCKFCRHH